MSDTNELLRYNELPWVACLECGKRIGNLNTKYALIVKTLVELVPSFKDETVSQNFQLAYNQRRQQHLNTVKNLRAEALRDIGVTDTNIESILEPEAPRQRRSFRGITFNLNDIDGARQALIEARNSVSPPLEERLRWKDIEKLAQMLKSDKDRKEQRQKWEEEALIQFRENELRSKGLPVTPENAVIINPQREQILDQIIMYRSTPKQRSDTGFMNLSIDEKLEKVGYPLAVNDPDWYNASLRKLNITGPKETIERALNRILNIPDLTILPQIKFTERDWKRLRSSAKLRDIQEEGEEGEEGEGQRQTLSHYGGVAMDHLGLIRSCCRQYLTQPAILPEESQLNLEETLEIERMDPYSLVLSRNTKDIEKPTEEAERLFLERKITSIQAYQPRHTRLGLAVKDSNIVNFTSPLNTIISGNTTIQNQSQIQANIYPSSGVVTQTPTLNGNIQGLPYQTRVQTQTQVPGIKMPIPTSTAPSFVGGINLPPLTFGGKTVDIEKDKQPTSQRVSAKIKEKIELPPPPTSGGVPLSIAESIERRNIPVDIGVVPKFDKSIEEPRCQLQPGGLEIPFEQVPGGVNVFSTV